MVWGSMSWDSEAAEAYAQLRTFCEGEGTPLGTMVERWLDEAATRQKKN